MTLRRLAVLCTAYLVTAAALADPDWALSWALRSTSVMAGRAAAALRTLSLTAGSAYLEVAYPAKVTQEAPPGE